MRQAAGRCPTASRRAEFTSGHGCANAGRSRGHRLKHAACRVHVAGFHGVQHMAGTMYAVVRTWGTRGTQVRYRFVALPLVRDLLSEPGAGAVPKYMLAPEDEPEPAPEPRSGRCGAWA